MRNWVQWCRSWISAGSSLSSFYLCEMQHLRAWRRLCGAADVDEVRATSVEKVKKKVSVGFSPPAHEYVTVDVKHLTVTACVIHLMWLSHGQNSFWPKRHVCKFKQEEVQTERVLVEKEVCFRGKSSQTKLVWTTVEIFINLHEDKVGLCVGRDLVMEFVSSYWGRLRRRVVDHSWPALLYWTTSGSKPG